tara:strand:+ start:347 stop:1117 length:771 start_codon:yes stop_codon:yes gene_type:complete
MNKACVFYTDHYVNQIVTQFLAKSQSLTFQSIENYQDNNQCIFTSYGILRGTGDIFKKSKNYIYIDHGYFNASARKFSGNKITVVSALSGYFRLIHNDFYFRANYQNSDPTRFNKLNIDLKDLNQKGEIIILSEPSEHILKFLNMPNWTQETLNKLKSLTDRKVIVHNKFSDIPLKSLMKKAFAFVSCQSTAGFMSISEGTPAYFTHPSFGDSSNIDNIEDRKLNHNLLFTAANSQWRLSEFFTDEFKAYFSNINL